MTLAERWPTMSSAWMAGEPVRAWPEPLADRVRRWARRNRTAVTAAAVALVVALAGTGAVLAVQTQSNVALTAVNRDLARANTTVQRSNEDLLAANARERERFELAMEAVNLFHGEVSEDILLKEKQFESLRTRLLRGAASFYAKLEERLEGQRDPASRAALGRACAELATLTARIGNLSEALTVQQRAIAARRELALAPGAGPQALIDLGESLLSAGALRTGTGDAGGIELCEEARALAERAVSSANNNDAMRLFHGRAYYILGIVYNQAARPAKALESLIKARSIQQAVADASPEVRFYQKSLAATEGDLGVAYKLTGHPNECARGLRSCPEHPGKADCGRTVDIRVPNGAWANLSQSGRVALADWQIGRRAACAREIAGTSAEGRRRSTDDHAISARRSGLRG